jgi:hypothetical protein
MSKKRFILLVLCILISFSISSPLWAQSRPIQLSLVTPIQIFPETDSIAGVRFNLLYGRNVAVTGLDIGLVNHVTTGKFVGLQHGLVGIVDTDFMGGQHGGVNVVQGRCEGFQWGMVNYANDMSGVQFGFVNYARTMKGLQIGLVNIIRQGGQFPVFPIVNWSF